MAAGPTDAQVARWKAQANKQCAEYLKLHPGETCEPYMMRASNGEACGAFKLNGNIVLVLPS